MKKPRCNFIYNDDEKLGFGQGYYYFFEGLAEEYKGQPVFGAYYPTEAKNENVDMITVGILNRLRQAVELGWQYDPYYWVDLTKEFKRRD